MSCLRFSFILPDSFVETGVLGLRCVRSWGENGMALYELMFWWRFWGTTAKEGERVFAPESNRPTIPLFMGTNCIYIFGRN